MEKERTSTDCALCLSHNKVEDHSSCDSNPYCADDSQSHHHCQDIQVDAQKTTGDHLPSSDKNLLKIQSLELPVLTLIRVTAAPLENLRTVEAIAGTLLTETTPLFIRHCTYRI